MDFFFTFLSSVVICKNQKLYLIPLLGIYYLLGFLNNKSDGIQRTEMVNNKKHIFDSRFLQI